MDQTTLLRPTERSRTTQQLADFIVASIDGASVDQAPFYHLRLSRIFPDDLYSAMQLAMWA